MWSKFDDFSWHIFFLIFEVSVLFEMGMSRGISLVEKSSIVCHLLLPWIGMGLLHNFCSLEGDKWWQHGNYMQLLLCPVVLTWVLDPISHLALPEGRSIVV